MTTRNVFGVLPDLTLPNQPGITLAPPSALARRIPLTIHPSQATLDPPDLKFCYQNKAEDPYFLERNLAKAEGRSDDTRQGGGEVEWGAWYELKDERDVLRAAMLPFVADNVRNMPNLIPKEMRPGPR